MPTKATIKKIVKPVKKKMPTVKKPARLVAKPVKNEAAPHVREAPGQSAVTVAVVNTQGQKVGKATLPGELFGAKVNKQLLAQAVRVYLANQREGSANTKTRGEVEGSTRKIYRQKGTGRARHGAIRAPIFVGGGIVFGPKPRNYRLSFPKKMKRLALASALTSQFRQGNVIVVDGLETLEPKTKVMASALGLIGVTKGSLLVLSRNADRVIQGVRNLDTIDMLPAQNLHPYTVLSHRKLIFMKDAVPILKETFVRSS